jgi:hypothetical protein
MRWWVALSMVVAACTGCEEDMGQSDWLNIENRSDERIYVWDVDSTNGLYVIGLSPGEHGLAGFDKCDRVELVARAGTEDGPVVATRTEADARDCTATWVIGTVD